MCRCRPSPRDNTPFNALVGSDVKWLPGWQVNQKIKALNIVRQGSCYQVPIHEKETASLLRTLFERQWAQWA